MNNKRALVPDNPCPIGRAVETIGDRWALLILRHATLGVSRFDDFRELLGISDSTLANRLAKLVNAGILVKVPYRDPRRTRYEYRLTEAGADLLPVLHALANWGENHTRSGKGVQRPMTIMHHVCGGEIQAGQFCPRCDREVERAEISWLRPWRSRDPFPLAEPVA
jgi:DNA-binding HxlR family transcriptional regulator